MTDPSEDVLRAVAALGLARVRRFDRDGQGIYSCEGMWEAALQGRLAALQVIEQAYTQSAVHGLGRLR